MIKNAIAFSNKTKVAVNVVTATLTLCATAGISFFLTPFIVKTLGVEAQGFTQLSANLVSYLSVATIALNSMSGRFISVAVHKNEPENAGKYYTSVLYGNIFIFAALLMPLALFIFYADRLIKIPDDIVTDVRILFALSFFNCFVWNILSQWSNAFYIKDRAYLQSISNCLNSLLYAALTVALFSLLPPKIWYTALAVLIAMSFPAIWGGYFKRRLLPDLRAKKALFSLTHLKEIILSGIWFSLECAGQLLLNGLDLLICNIMIDAKTMGVLALSKIFPQFISRLTWSISTTFAPQLTIKYATGDFTGMRRDIKRSAKITACIGTIPLAGLMVFGKDFFMLWLPGQNAGLLWMLSILACFPNALLSGVDPCCNIFATVNKVKPQGVSVIISGAISTLTVLILLNFTHMGVYAVAGTSAIVWVLGDIVYIIPAAARYLGLKWHTFFYVFGYSMTGTLIATLVGLGVKAAIPTGAWAWLLTGCLVTGIVALVANILVIFDKDERKMLRNSFVKTIKRLMPQEDNA
ncbi:MAG: MATE family efflux transporter [Clostridiales bacterium]|nr:MATE family efflux transporter [Clostridiales bacterium]